MSSSVARFLLTRFGDIAVTERPRPARGIELDVPDHPVPATVTQTFLEGHGRAQWDPADKVELGDRRLVPREIFVHIRGGKKEPDILMKIEVREGIPRWAEVALRARPDGPEVRDRDLSAIRLNDWLERIVAMASTVAPGGDTVWSKPEDDRTAAADIRRAVSGRPRTVTPELLQKVAAIYRQHFDKGPTEAVKRSFGVSHRTAARYVQQARAAGHLPETDPGKKKA
jgi:hypothetical protein